MLDIGLGFRYVGKSCLILCKSRLSIHVWLSWSALTKNSHNATVTVFFVDNQSYL